MSETLDISSTELADKRGHKGPERRCMASGETRHKQDMIRFVLGPDNIVTPDINEKLPGRGVWVSSDKTALETAIKSGGFARGFKAKVKVPDDLTELTETLLRRRISGLLAMGMKSGHLFVGFDQVKTAAQSDYLAWRIEASDGSEGPRGKIRVLTKAMSHELERPMTPVIGCFSSQDLGKAFGRDHIVHAALRPGSLAKALTLATQRYSGFSTLIPEEWADKNHEKETKKNPEKRRD